MDVNDHLMTQDYLHYIVTMVYRREALEELGAHFFPVRGAEDILFNKYIYLYEYKINRYDTPIYLYTSGRGSFCHTLDMQYFLFFFLNYVMGMKMFYTREMMIRHPHDVIFKSMTYDVELLSKWMECVDMEKGQREVEKIQNEYPLLPHEEIAMRGWKRYENLLHLRPLKEIEEEVYEYLNYYLSSDGEFPEFRELHLERG